MSQSAAFERIMYELTTHPKEKTGFVEGDFRALSDSERNILIERFMQEADYRWGFADQLQWLLGMDYIPALQRRLQSLPRRSSGLVYLPYYLYRATGRREYLLRMMREVVLADPSWEGRERAVADYLRKVIGKDPIYWDFCRYLVLHDANRSMKAEALRWLAREKGYPLNGLSLTVELEECIDQLMFAAKPSEEAIKILNRVHTDNGHFSP